MALEFEKIESNYIKINGIQALADRPNSASVYGKGGLSASELKEWFDKTSVKFIDNFNMLYELFAGNRVVDGQTLYITDYIKLSGINDIESLSDLLEAISTGALASLIMLSMSETSEKKSLQNAIYEIVQDIATEVSTRANADAALEGQITAEAGARANADAALDGKITAEADARTSADTALGQGIDGCVKKAEVSIEAQDNTVVRRDGNGNIIVNTPAENTSSLDKSVAINTAFADKRYLGKIQVAYNSQSHLITFTQLDAEGNTMETPYDIDLPLESLVTNIDDVVVDGERYLQLTLQNDDVKNIALNEIFNGFVKTSVNKSIIYGNDDNGDQTSYAIDDIILLEKRANDNGIVGIAAKGFESKDSTEWVNLGHESEATGLYSFAEGKCTHATGERSHAEGSNTRATHTSTHAEGYNTEAVNHGAHAEGGSTEASGRASHSEGVGTKSTGEAAHAEGYETVADYRAHSEGEYTKASGRASHAGGTHTIASGASQTAIGKYNKKDNNALFIVGNGTADGDDYRSNAFVVNQDGTATIAKAPVNEMDVVNKGYLDAVKAYLESNMSPSEVDLEQYFLAMDTTAVDILMSNAKKCTLSIGMRADVDTPGTTDVFTDEFWSNSTYSFTFTPTEVTPLTEDSYGYLTGSIIGDVIAVNVDAPDGYIVKSATATRFNLALVIYDIETEDIGVQMSTDLTLTVTSPNGIIETFSELLEIHSYRNVDDEWEYKVKKLIVFVPKNDETSPYIPEATATYDLRTQAIDNRLKALIDEAIAKRRAALGETETTEKS